MTLRSRFKGDKCNEESRRIRDEMLNDALARNRDADVGELLWGQLKPSRPHPQRSVPLMRVSRFAARNEPRNRLTHYT